MQTTTFKQWDPPFPVQGYSHQSWTDTLKCCCVLLFLSLCLRDVLLFDVTLCISNCCVKVATKKKVAPPLSLIYLTLSSLTPNRG